MNKQTEALKMAIEALDDLELCDYATAQKAIQACKDALEQPAPSWQGLSDDEIDRLSFYDYMTTEEAINVVRVIEQALREKNER